MKMLSIITITVLVLVENVRLETCASIQQLPIKDFKTEEYVDIQKDCGPGRKPCVMKCCGVNEVYFKPIGNVFTCRNIGDLAKEFASIDEKSVLDYSTLDIITQSNKTVSFFEDFRLLYSDRYINKPCTRTYFVEVSITENGTAILELSADDLISYDAPEFCMDKVLGFGPGGSGDLHSLYFHIIIFKDYSSVLKFLLYGGLISAFFLFLILVVHCLIKFLHDNPKDKLLMCFVSCMMLYNFYQVWYAFSVLKASEKPMEPTADDSLPACKWVAPIGYYLFVSAFFWLNAMCYEIWRKFRSSKLRSLDDKKKMCLYSAYALGMPLLSTVIALLLDAYGSEEVKPGFATCMRDSMYIWKRLYIRLPSGLVVLSNMVMLVATLRNVHRMRFVQPARKDSMHTRKRNALSNVYQHLFILMGVNWLIDIVVTPIPDFEDWAYFLVTVPNGLLGLWIFLVTVCKKKIFIMLCRRFGFKNQWIQSMNRTQESQVASTSKSIYKTRNTDG